jgi:hypothetical protein
MPSDIADQGVRPAKRRYGDTYGPTYRPRTEASRSPVDNFERHDRAVDGDDAVGEMEGAEHLAGVRVAAISVGQIMGQTTL